MISKVAIKIHRYTAIQSTAIIWQNKSHIQLVSWGTQAINQQLLSWGTTGTDSNIRRKDSSLRFSIPREHTAEIKDTRKLPPVKEFFPENSAVSGVC